MPDMIKKISIMGTPNDTRDIGAEAQNVIVSYDVSGNIITDITVPGVVVDHTASVADALTNATPDDHADPTDKYGPGDVTNYGHIKLGTGLERNATTGATDVKYGTTSGTAAAGNDSRLSDARKNPYAAVFTNGSTNTSYDGSASQIITYAEVGAAPVSHASSTTDYGVATANNYGHVKIGDGLAATSGVVRVNADGSTIVINPDGTISATAGEGGHITLHQNEYNALPTADKADPNKYYFIDDVDTFMDECVVLKSTLPVGSTTVTFTDASINDNSLIDFFTDPYGIVPNNAVQSGNTVLLTFNAQSSAVKVALMVK